LAATWAAVAVTLAGQADNGQAQSAATLRHVLEQLDAVVERPEAEPVLPWLRTFTLSEIRAAITKEGVDPALELGEALIAWRGDQLPSRSLLTSIRRVGRGSER